MKTVQKLPEIALDKRPFKVQLDEALSFFDAPDLGKTLVKEEPYSDKDGLIEFICGTELISDPIITAELERLKSLLISVTTVVTSYVLRYSEKKGVKYKTDAELWEKAVSNIPLMGPSKIEQKTYKKQTRGIQIATDFILMILDVAAKDGSALTGFRDWLKQQGDSLRAGIEETKGHYNTFVLGVSVEAFKLGDKVIYVPKIKQYKIVFTRENSKWSSSCASYEEISMEFEYSYSANVFDYEALNNEETKKSFEAFITKQQKAQIEDADTFFNDDFEA